MAAIFEAYLDAINKDYQTGDAREHTYRPALKTFVEGLRGGIHVQNEPKHLITCGAPDMKVSREIRRSMEAFGYIECKDIGIDLKKAEKSEQLKRYLAGIDNLILTDYITFRFYRLGELIETAALAKEGKAGKFVIAENGIADVQKLFALFFISEPIRISSAKLLAEKMAGIAKNMRYVIGKTFDKESEKGTLHGQYEAFKKVLLHDLKEEDFADMYAQTICYGLFTARYYKTGPEAFTRLLAPQWLPKTNPFLRKTFGHIAGYELDERIAWIVDDLAGVLDNVDMAKIKRDFGHASGKLDPVVHFYETFLAAYDPKLREKRGVYYTPEPVVSYIVRSVDWLLKEKFGLKQGLKDDKKIKVNTPSPLRGTPTLQGESLKKEVHRCLILDPAVGTGTFLYEVIKQIHKKFRDKGVWNAYVQDHLLPRLFGFELMMAPYAVCHMKLGLELAETGYDFAGDERLGVFLTNTLEEAEDISGLLSFGQWISEEAREANTVKRDLPIMVVLGNPPYSGHSANASEKIIYLEPGQKYTIKNRKGKYVQKTVGANGKKIKEKTFIGSLIQDYYKVDGKGLGEKNPKWLQDDYVKFIRYGQYRIEQTGNGILAFITNHGYLDNPTFRGMRQQLMKTFNEIYILDLHGNAKKKEVCPDGSPDKNVFDIQQGVSIGIFVKEPDSTYETKVYHYERWGERIDKYDWLNSNEIKSTDWKVANPAKPYYFFVKRDVELSKEYLKYNSIKNMFHILLLGPNSHRDHFAISFSEKEALSRIDDFFNNKLSNDFLREKYDLKDNRDWNLNDARKNNPEIKTPVACLYRPFDKRFMLYGSYAFDYHRPEINDNLLHENYGFITTRQTKEQFSVFVCSQPVGQHKLATPYDGSYISPLYIYPSKALFDDTGGDWEPGVDGRVPNLDKEFVDAVREATGLGFVSDGRGDLGKNQKSKSKKQNKGTACGGLNDPKQGCFGYNTFGPEDVFAWIYGVFHSPQYRARYAEFLKIDFPRVPLPEDKKQFAEVCEVGHALVGLHLMEAEVLENPDLQPRFAVEGDREVAKGYPKYDAGKVYINEKQNFDGVREDVWTFMIGGYQVCEKWLKDRRGRQLSYDDVQHYQKICVALAETIRLMADKRLAIFK